jgi:MYXO-CTERM domain-containing protein
MKAVVVSIAVIVGLAFIGIAALYWLTPAGELPAFVPLATSRDPVSPTSTTGLGALILGLAALAFAWWFRRRAD